MRKTPNDDAEMVRLGTELLRTMAEWSEPQTADASCEGPERTWEAMERRVGELRELFDPIWPTTPAGLAIMMRVEFATVGPRWLPNAIVRPTGPTKRELDTLGHQGHMSWLFIDCLERIAGLRYLSPLWPPIDTAGRTHGPAS